jgi:hypothetical protein
MVAGGHLHFDNEHNVSSINGNRTVKKMTRVWRKSVKRFWRYHNYCVLASYQFIYGKMRGGKTQLQPKLKRIQSWAKQRQSGVHISNSSKVIAFSNVGLRKFKMAADGQNGGISRRRLASRFLLSRGEFVLNEMIVAFVASSQYISLHTDIQTYRHTYRQTSVDSIIQIHS